MMLKEPTVRIDKKYGFYSMFNDKTGVYVRSGIIKNGKDSGIDPFMAEFPHLIDVGIMGHCAHGKAGSCKVGCYQSGFDISRPNMTLDNFESIVRQCAGKIDQFALGGRGDPDMHENFSDIIEICRANNIVPNFTTSGYEMTAEIAHICRSCGAVAVSWYRSDYTTRAIKILLHEGIKTNIHYVLANSTIDEAIRRLESDDFPKRINAVIFLLYKPVGAGKSEDVLHLTDPRLSRFFELVDTSKVSFKIGFDSCTAPGIVNHSKSILSESMDTCEGGRFSCYISADMQMLPCSFDQELKYAVNLRKSTIAEAWDSGPFNNFRANLHEACPDCDRNSDCMGGCPLLPNIVLCDKKL